MLAAEPSEDLHESVRACIAEGRLNSALKQHSGPGRAVHLALKITASREEAEHFCVRILPFAEGLKRVKAMTLRVARRQIALEQDRIRQRERLAAVALQLDLVKVGLQIQALSQRHSARR